MENLQVYCIWNIIIIIFQDFIITNTGKPCTAAYKLWLRFAGNKTAQETRTGYNVKSSFKFIKYVKFIVDHWFVPASAISSHFAIIPKGMLTYLISFSILQVKGFFSQYLTKFSIRSEKICFSIYFFMNVTIQSSFSLVCFSLGISMIPL